MAPYLLIYFLGVFKLKAQFPGPSCLNQVCVSASNKTSGTACVVHLAHVPREPHVCISSQLHLEYYHVGSLKLTMMGIFEYNDQNWQVLQIKSLF